MCEEGEPQSTRIVL